MCVCVPEAYFHRGRCPLHWLGAPTSPGNRMFWNRRIKRQNKVNFRRHKLRGGWETAGLGSSGARHQQQHAQHFSIPTSGPLAGKTQPAPHFQGRHPSGAGFLFHSPSSHPGVEALGMPPAPWCPSAALSAAQARQSPSFTCVFPAAAWHRTITVLIPQLKPQVWLSAQKHRLTPSKPVSALSAFVFLCSPQ